jgi:hypothetical protein
MAYLKKWTEVYLTDARQRLQQQLDGYELSTEDVYILQQV